MRYALAAVTFAAMMLAGPGNVVAAPVVPTTNLISGHGANVSQDPRFGIYFTELGGGTMLQATDDKGTILFTTVARDGVVQVLPIGTLHDRVNVAAFSDPTGAKDVQIDAKDTIACPCHTVVPDDGPNGTIIAIYDANGNIAQVIVLPAKPR